MTPRECAIAILQVALDAGCEPEDEAAFVASVESLVKRACNTYLDELQKIARAVVKSTKS